MFRWASFLELADELAEGDNEAAKRSAMSRGYYAAFNVAKNHVARIYPAERIYRDGRAHKQIWEYLQSPGRNRIERNCGVQGERALESRKQADYWGGAIKNLRDCVATSLRWSKRVVDSLGKE